MAGDNAISNPGSGGITWRSLGDAGNVEWAASVICFATTVSPGANVLSIVQPNNGLPIQLATGATFNVSVNTALPAGSALIGGVELVDSGGTNKASISAAGAVKVDGSAVTQPVSGTLTANQGGSWTVTANAGTGTFTVTDAALELAQASATSGQKGPLIQGAVTTGAPTYTTGNTNPLSLTTAGALRVDASATTQPVSGTVTANLGTLNGAALDATLTGGSQKTKIVDSGGTNVATVSAGGALKVDNSANTQPVSGTITANAGTGTFATSDLADGPVTPGAAATKSLLIGGQFNTSAPTLTTGQQAALQVDSSGNLNVNVKAGGGSGGTSSTFSAAFPGTGTAAGASDGVNMKPLLVDASGFLKVNVAAGGGAGGTSSSFGAAVPATGTAAGFSDGTNMELARVFDLDSTAGSQYVAGVNLRTTGSGGSTELIGQQAMAGSIPVVIASNQSAVPVSGTVTANAGTGTFAVSGTVTANIGTAGTLALDTSVNGLLVSQGSTTSGEKGPLIQGAVTTAAPSYTTAQTSPLSLTTAGALRVDGSAVTQPVSGTVTANAGTGTFGVSGTVTANVGTTNGLALDATLTGGSQKSIPVAGTSGGATPYHLISAASTNATSVKGSAGQVYSVTAFNTNASARFLKLYDKATAPSVGTDTPVQTYLIPGNASGAGLTLALPVGMGFSSGVALAITGAMPDSDTTAIGANDVCVALTYK